MAGPGAVLGAVCVAAAAAGLFAGFFIMYATGLLVGDHVVDGFWYHVGRRRMHARRAALLLTCVAASSSDGVREIILWRAT